MPWIQAGYDNEKATYSPVDFPLLPLSLRSEMASKVLLLGVCLGSLCRGTESFLVRSPPQSLTSSKSTVELYSTKAATLPPPVKRQDTLKEEILSMIAVPDGDENVVSNIEGRWVVHCRMH